MDKDFRKKGRSRPSKSHGNKIGETLAERRLAQGWTLEDAETHSGISKRIIAKLEKGGSNTSLANLERYLAFYGLKLTIKIAENENSSTVESELLEV